MAFPLLKVGCCGFPLTKLEYARLFPVVEVQQTFYQPPRLKTLRLWRAQVPPQFEFTLKAWQLVTHPASSPTYRRVTTQLAEGERRECGAFQPTDIVQEAWLISRACAEALSAQFILFQCPASFTPNEAQVRNLRLFFSRIERRQLRLLWEPRGAWPEPLLKSLCRELDLVHVVDPFLRRTVTPELVYYRIHGGSDYRHDYVDSELRQLLALVPFNRAAYVMFNNAHMLENAQDFQVLAQQASPPRPVEAK